MLHDGKLFARTNGLPRSLVAVEGRTCEERAQLVPGELDPFSIRSRIISAAHCDVRARGAVPSFRSGKSIGVGVLRQDVGRPRLLRRANREILQTSWVPATSYQPLYPRTKAPEKDLLNQCTRTVIASAYLSLRG